MQLYKANNNYQTNAKLFKITTWLYQRCINCLHKVGIQYENHSFFVKTYWRQFSLLLISKLYKIFFPTILKSLFGWNSGNSNFLSVVGFITRDQQNSKKKHDWQNKSGTTNNFLFHSECSFWHLPFCSECSSTMHSEY